MLGITQEKTAERPGITRSCEHRKAVDILWIVNNGVDPPAVLICGESEKPFVVTLTNQTFYVKCPACFKATILAQKRN